MSKSKGKVMGICPVCFFNGDATIKELHNSHVVPHSIFRRQIKRNGAQLGNRLIIMSSNAEDPLDVTQDQGSGKMLCFECEQKLSTEIEKPALEWSRRQVPGQPIEANSVLLARYAASVWWRAMFSKHRYHKSIPFNGKHFWRLIEASMQPHKTLENVSIRLRNFQDSTGALTVTALEQFQATILNHLPDEKLVQDHACFALIHEMYVWEVFSPRLKQNSIDKLQCFKSDCSRYDLKPYDISREPAFIEHAAQQRLKHIENNTTLAFRKFFRQTKE